MTYSKRIAVFPGSFDPFTIGHKAIIEKALPLFDNIIIAIGVNSQKTPFFSLEKRINHIESVFKNKTNISIKTYTGLTTTFCQEHNAGFIIRGVRNSIDFEFEKNIAQMNHEISSGIETIFFVTPPELSHISSTIVRELLRFGSDVSSFIPGEI